MTRMTRREAMAYHPSNYAHRRLERIYGPDDFDQTVRDAQAVVEAGKRRLRVVGEDERGIPAMLFSTSRHRRAKLMDGLAVALLMALMAAFGVIVMLLAAPSAKADIEPTPAVLDYADRYGEQAICVVLDEHHSVSGLLGVLLAIEKDGFTPYQAGQIVGISVTEFCPRNAPLIQRFVQVYGGQVTA